MKKIALRTYGKMITLLMSLFGFITGCGEPLVEYGAPSADFKVQGSVKSAATGKAIPDIRVIAIAPFTMTTDTAITDTGGDYSMELRSIIGFPVTIYADDIDGEANGSYVSDSIVVKQEDATQIKKGDNNWDKGDFEKKDANFHLVNPQTTPMYGVRHVNEND
jgi:putative lipoprotein (rSAM/lipoprotein system)